MSGQQYTNRNGNGQRGGGNSNRASWGGNKMATNSPPRLNSQTRDSHHSHDHNASGAGGRGGHRYQNQHNSNNYSGNNRGHPQQGQGQRHFYSNNNQCQNQNYYSKGPGDKPNPHADFRNDLYRSSPEYIEMDQARRKRHIKNHVIWEQVLQNPHYMTAEEKQEIRDTWPIFHAGQPIYVKDTAALGLPEDVLQMVNTLGQTTLPMSRYDREQMARANAQRYESAKEESPPTAAWSCNENQVPPLASGSNQNVDSEWSHNSNQTGSGCAVNVVSAFQHQSVSPVESTEYAHAVTVPQGAWATARVPVSTPAPIVLDRVQAVSQMGSAEHNSSNDSAVATLNQMKADEEFARKCQMEEQAQSQQETTHVPPSAAVGAWATVVKDDGASAQSYKQRTHNVPNHSYAGGQEHLPAAPSKDDDQIVGMVVPSKHKPKNEQSCASVKNEHVDDDGGVWVQKPTKASLRGRSNNRGGSRK